jgi:hypothetical protein
MTSNHQHILALIENAVHDALMDISEDSGLTIEEAQRLVFDEVLTEDDDSLQYSVLQGLNGYLCNVMLLE